MSTKDDEALSTGGFITFTIIMVLLLVVIWWVSGFLISLIAAIIRLGLFALLFGFMAFVVWTWFRSLRRR